MYLYTNHSRYSDMSLVKHHEANTPGLQHFRLIISSMCMMSLCKSSVWLELSSVWLELSSASKSQFTENGCLRIVCCWDDFVRKLWNSPSLIACFCNNGFKKLYNRLHYNKITFCRGAWRQINQYLLAVAGPFVNNTIE